MNPGRRGPGQSNLRRGTEQAGRRTKARYSGTPAHRGEHRMVRKPCGCASKADKNGPYLFVSCVADAPLHVAAEDLAQVTERLMRHLHKGKSAANNLRDWTDAELNLGHAARMALVKAGRAWNG